MVTDPRGGRRNQVEEEVGGPGGPGGLGRRNQFDRASQLRRSKKRKKSRENSGLEVSQASSEISRLSSRQTSPAKTSAKDIAIQETVKTLKSATSQNTLNASSESDNRSGADYFYQSVSQSVSEFVRNILNKMKIIRLCRRSEYHTKYGNLI